MTLILIGNNHLLKDKLHIRYMTLNDIAKVYEIESQTQIKPWSIAIFEDCIAQAYTNWVVEQEGEIIAFGILNILKPIREAHLMNIGVAPTHQRQGIGQWLLNYMLERVKKEVNFVHLEVRVSNKIALALYQKVGFKRIGQRKDYYVTQTEKEDAILLVLCF